MTQAVGDCEVCRYLKADRMCEIVSKCISHKEPEVKKGAAQGHTANGPIFDGSFVEEHRCRINGLLKRHLGYEGHPIPRAEFRFQKIDPNKANSGWEIVAHIDPPDDTQAIYDQKIVSLKVR